MFNFEQYDKLHIPKAIVEALRYKTIVVTGGSGLIGVTLIGLLIYLNQRNKLKLKVVSVSRTTDELVRIFETAISQGILKSLSADVTHLTSVDFRVDYIIHAASPADPLSFSRYPVETALANIIGTLNMLNILRGYKEGRLLYVSSGEVYGELDSSISKTEEVSGYIDPLDFRSCYPTSKRAAENLCCCFKKEYCSDVVIARLCYVYGPNISEKNSRADAQFLRMAAKTSSIIMKSSGSQRRSYCYVADAVLALLFILVFGVSGQAYNVSNPDSVVTINEYAQVLAKLAKVDIVRENPSHSEQIGYSKIKEAILDPSKLLSLGWRPVFDIYDGLKMTLDNYDK